MSEQLTSQGVGFVPFDELVRALDDRETVMVYLRNCLYQASLKKEKPAIIVGSLQKRDGLDVETPMYEYTMSSEGDLVVQRLTEGAESLCPSDQRDPVIFFRSVSWLGRFIVNGVV